MNNQKGLSLVEMVLAVVVFSVGLVAIDQMLLASYSNFHYLSNRMEAERLLANKIWEIESRLSHGGAFPNAREAGNLMGTRKRYFYEIKTETKAESEQGSDPKMLLQEANLHLQWNETGRKKGFTRSFYLFKTENA